MHSFRLVPASEGPRREFTITLGLRAGYGFAGRIYRLEEAIRTAHRWMRERAARGAPFLSGMGSFPSSVPRADFVGRRHNFDPLPVSMTTSFRVSGRRAPSAGAARPGRRVRPTLFRKSAIGLFKDYIDPGYRGRFRLEDRGRRDCR